MDGYRNVGSMVLWVGVAFEVLDVAEFVRRHPLILADNLVGGLWDASDCDIDPTPPVA